jgi:prepilin signal peptidase PulO-like enzyme (type II secretory pathway)
VRKARRHRGALSEIKSTASSGLIGIAPFLTAYLILVALMFGSFINMAADRAPRGESLIRPGSHCRACGRRLNVVDLLPVAGYLVRRGRCATCGSPIGITAPIVETTSGVLMMAAIAWLGLWPGAAAGLGLVALWGLLVTWIAFQVRRATQSLP